MMEFLRIKNLSKIYLKKNKIQKEALRDISFSLNEGEIFALLGANGAGKTTLSSILASLHPPTSGDVIWKDQSIYKNILSYRRLIGFCPQKPNIDRTLNLTENLIFTGLCYGFSKKEAEKRAEQLLNRFNLEAYSQVDASILSGGYKQRFLIARALVHHPKFIILDEPTVGLDPQVRQQLWQLIKSLKEEGATVLLTTHYLDEAEVLSDRVCIIHDGKVRLIDTPQNLMEEFKKEKLEEVFLQLMEEGNA